MGSGTIDKGNTGKKTNEQKRLKRLKQLMVLDTAAEPLFDEITKLASQICETPIALISLVDKDRQWFKSNVGIEEATETPRDISFCTHAIEKNDIFEVPDALKNKTFKQNPLVTAEPNIRFYAGMPLTMPDGSNIGTLCVIDRKPKHLNAMQKRMLMELGSIVSEALVFREHAIHEAESKNSTLAAIVESSTDAIISKTLDGIVTSWNKGAEKLFGFTTKEMIGQPIIQLFPLDKVEEEATFINKIKNNEKITHFETERVSKSKKRIKISVSLSPVKNALGEIVGVSTIARDITAIKELQQKLALEHERLKVTMDSIGDAVITTNKQGNVQYLNPVAEHLTGWNLDAAKDQPLHKVFKIVHEQTRAPCINPVQQCLQEDRIIALASHTTLISRNGKEYGIEDSAAPIKDEEGNTLGVVLVFHDVSAQRKLAHEINYRATHDTLTGLINRGEFEVILKEHIDHQNTNKIQSALLFIDLDKFKLVNDTCGHTAGDKLLKEVAKLIKSRIRSSDIFARIGGDEFAVILPACDAKKSLEIATEICQSVDSYRFVYNENRFHIGASIGLVMMDDQWESETAVMQAADHACYIAKSEGRNRVHLHHSECSDFENNINEIQWVSRIEQALENNEFKLFCQRILPLNHDGGEHLEVLLRLQEKSGDLLSPGMFLPAAERFHLMTRIDRWVVKTLFDWIESNIDRVTPVELITINISGQSLNDKSFHQYLKEIILSANFDCAKICFEITETVAITNISDAIAFLELLKKYGIKVSLDDFGSGVSSFGYLKNLPVDYLKIDGQFIRDLNKNPIGQATVKCIAEVAKITNKQTIAEWVEDETIEVLLKDMGIDYSQGFFRHKPEPLNQVMLQTTAASNNHGAIKLSR